MRSPLARRSATICAFTSLLLVAGAAAAQDRQGRLAVVLVDDVGFDVENQQVVQAGIEDIVSQFGEFELVSAAAMESDLSRDDRRAIEGCRVDGACYADVLLTANIDFVLVATVFDQGEEYGAELSAINLHAGEVVGFQEGAFPEPAETLFLLVPVFESIGPLADVDLPSAPPPRAGRDRDSDRDSGRDSGRDRDTGRDSGRDRTAATGRDRDRASSGDRGTSRDRTADRGRDRGTSGDRRAPNPLLEQPSGDGGANVLATALTVGGGALVGTGLIFWLLADDTQLEIQARPHERAELEDLQSTGDSQATIGNIMVITGAVALATGIVFHIAGVGEPSPSGSRTQFIDDYSSNGVTVGVGGTLAAPTLNLSMDF